MYKTTLSLLLGVFTITTFAQTTAIPDGSFETMLINLGIDSNGFNGNILNSDAQGVTTLNIGGGAIADLSGIEAFTNLLVLNCQSNNLTSLDLSSNENLYALHCYNNNISSITLHSSVNLNAFSCYDNNLSTLDVSAHTNLQILNCKSNNLSTLDVSNNTNLKILNLGSNNLSSIDVSNNTALENLNLSDNNLSSLNVTSNPLLQLLTFSYNTISHINLTNNPALSTLICVNNNISSINLSSNPALTNFNISTNNLSAIDLSNNTLLELVTVSNNAITELDLSAQSVLESLFAHNNNLTSLNVKNGNNHMIPNNKFSANDNPNLTCVNVDDITYSHNFWLYRDTQTHYSTNCADETYIPDNNFEQALINEGYDAVLDDYVVSDNIRLITNLDLEDESIASLEGIEDFLNLRTLSCASNLLTSLDVSNNILLKVLECGNNQLTSLDLTQNPELTGVYCSSNQLTSFNMNNGENDKITNFAAMNNPNLYCIEVDNIAYATNNWTSVDAQTHFSSDCNGETKIDDTFFEQALIDLGHDTVLNGYVITSAINNISTLNLSDKNISDLTGIQAFAQLQTLICNKNNLNKLDVSQNPGLEVLDCSNNGIEILDLSSNGNLTNVIVSENALQSFNLKNGKNDNIIEFNAKNNPSLTCIQVDDASYSSSNWDSIDGQTSFSDNCSLSIDQVINGISYSMYPNPVINDVIISLDAPTSYQLFDVKGQMLLKGQLTSGENTISMLQLSKGMYFLRLQQNNHAVHTQKIIKE